jgi:hypothetical protein
MTVTMLLVNTITSAERTAGVASTPAVDEDVVEFELAPE